MQNRNKILVITVIISILMIHNVYAQTGSRTAQIRELSGTVEIRKAGSETWQPASRGQNISSDTTISTGFKSSALIAMGDSLLTVRPLTRLTLTELSMIQDTESIQLNLQTGRVRADVKAPAGAKAQFTVQSPSATASVRGTVFEFDTLNLWVSEGTVEFSGASNVPVLVDAGRFSYSDERSGRAINPETAIIAEMKPELPFASDAVSSGESAPALGAFVPEEAKGGISITIGF